MENYTKEDLLALSSFLNEAIHTLNKIQTSAVSLTFTNSDICDALSDCIHSLEYEFTEVKTSIRKEVYNHEA